MTTGAWEPRSAAQPYRFSSLGLRHPAADGDAARKTLRALEAPELLAADVTCWGGHEAMQKKLPANDDEGFPRD
jgi:hypothetical protein